MPDLKVKNSKKIDPYHKAEFEMFKNIMKSGQAMHLYKIAELLGVRPETISEWKKDPAVIAAQAEGISKALEGMRKSGKDDWRMYDRTLALSGLVSTNKTDITTDGEPITFVFRKED